MKELIKNFLKKNDLNIAISYEMPKGYESAYGTYDFFKNTLFVNEEKISQNKALAVFTFFHELHHAMQFNKPEEFSNEINEFLGYVILYDGTCYKVKNSEWKSCKLKGSPAFYKRAYLSLPYEIDANEYALKKSLEVLNKEDSDRLMKFYKTNCVTDKKLTREEIITIAKAIDKEVDGQ